MAELMANTGAYMRATRVEGSSAPTFLPAIGTMQSSFQPYETYPNSISMRQTLTTLPWRTSTYYGTAQVNTGVPNTYSMPEPLSEKYSLTQVDSIKVPPIFSAARDSLYTRYTSNDWTTSSLGHHLAAEKVRVGSERVRFGASRLCRELEEKTKRTQEDVGKKLGDRLGDIDYWRTEVKHETGNILTEIEALARVKAALEKMLLETDNPLKIAEECLYKREKRQGIDLVHDDVERMLIKEVDNIKRCQEEIRRMIQAANNQLSLDRATQHELEKDFGDKNIAHRMDSVSHQLKNNSRGINFYEGIERVDNTVSVPLSWAEFSNNIVQRSRSERLATVNIRKSIEQLMNNVTDSIADNWNNVGSAFAVRIKEYIDARNTLQIHLSKVLQEIFDMEKSIELLKRSITEKESPLQVAQTRLVTRVRRPNVESCRDVVQYSLVEEVYEIGETVEQLRTKLREMEVALQKLLRTKLSLEHDLAIKNNSILVDRENCMGIRKTLPWPSMVAVY